MAGFVGTVSIGTVGIDSATLLANDPVVIDPAENDPALRIGELSIRSRHSSSQQGLEDPGPGEINPLTHFPNGAPRRVNVPVFIDGGGDVDYAQVSIYYDDAQFRYENVRVTEEARRDGWGISSLAGFRERSEGNLRGVFVRTGERSGETTQSIALFEIVFAVLDPHDGDLDSETLLDTSQVSFYPIAGHGGSSDSFVGYLDDGALEGDNPTVRATWRETQLTPGSVTIFHREFVEVGSGDMTRTEQTFRVPLYMTLFRPGDLVRVGIDYDELILREIGIRAKAVESIEVDTDESGQASAQLSFRFAAPSKGSSRGPLFRTHVADLEFHFDGTLGPRFGSLVILPSFTEDENGQGDGEAASGEFDGVSGVITFVEPRFVRGNVDSQTPGGRSSLPDLHDALIILRGLFLDEGLQLPCAEAADTDDSGDIELTDAVLLLNFLFQGGTPPAAPFPEVGTDPRSSSAHLGCESSLPFFEPRASI